MPNDTESSGEASGKESERVGESETTRPPATVVPEEATNVSTKDNQVMGESSTSLDSACLFDGDPTPPETTSPNRNILPWGPPEPKRSQRDLLSIIKEEEEAAAAKRALENDTTRLAELAQEEELVRLALERSMTDMQVGGSSSHVVNQNFANSSSSGSLALDDFTLRVQEEAETTEGFVETPHTKPSQKRILIKPSANSQRSLVSETSTSSRSKDSNASHDRVIEEARRNLSPEEVEQIERALRGKLGIDEGSPLAASSSPPGQTSSVTTSSKLRSQYDLDKASQHLSREELDQIEKALRDAEVVGSSQSPSKNTNGLDQKLPAASLNGVSDESATCRPQKNDAGIVSDHLSQEESEAIKRAVKEADEEQERRSVLLALQMMEEDDMTQRSNRASRNQGKIRTMTRAELEAERTQRVGAFHSSAPPIMRHPLEEAEEEVSAGFRMNASARQEWARRDQNSIVGPNNEVRTKHDTALQGKANAQRLGLDVGESGEGTIVGNQAYNDFMKSMRRTKKGVEAYGSGRAGSDTDGTKGGAMDYAVRIEISRAINSGLIEKCNGTVKEGKEAVLYHADGGRESDGFDVAVKVFKRIQEFKARGDYVVGDPRYSKTSFKSLGPREQLALWAEKEFRNLVRANRAGVPVPTPLLFKENILFMRFLGTDGWPSPQLRELNLRQGSSRWTTMYTQVMDAVKLLYQGARLVHGDLSEYNVLVVPAFLVENQHGGTDSLDELQTVLIDFGQAVDVRHPEAPALLERDVERVQSFFRRVGVDVMSLEESLQFVVGSE